MYVYLWNGGVEGVRMMWVICEMDGTIVDVGTYGLIGYCECVEVCGYVDCAQ